MSNLMFWVRKQIPIIGLTLIVLQPGLKVVLIRKSPLIGLNICRLEIHIRPYILVEKTDNYKLLVINIYLALYFW